MSFLSSEAELLTWQDQGLPADTLSAQNALAILHGVHTPFIIDPSSQVLPPCHVTVFMTSNTAAGWQGGVTCARA